MKLMTGLSSHSAPAYRFRLVVILVGLMAAMATTHAEWTGGFDGAQILLLAALAFLAERYPLELPGYGVVSGLESAVFASLLLGHVGGAFIVLASGIISRGIRRGKAFRLNFSLYSVCQVGLCYTAPFLVLQQFSVASGPALIAAAIGAILADQAFAAYHLFLLQDRLGRFTTRVEYARLRLSSVALLPLGLLLAGCLEQGPVATTLLLLPLALAFHGIKTYVDTLREARDVVASMVEAVERRESGTEGHADRVADWAGSIAREMRLQERAVRRIVAAARMHDLGKIGIEESILNKVGVLSPEEVERLRRHPEVGAKVASHLSLGKQEAEFIFHHHENFDGTGYPMGLAGQQIPQGARILAVAEAFDSMITTSHGSGQMTPRAAMAELEDSQGRQFDPCVVAAFRNVLRKRIA
jgi:HD-GYP domain-containing protein (c-di-GMP phosphodiesterase class II)